MLPPFECPVGAPLLKPLRGIVISPQNWSPLSPNRSLGNIPWEPHKFSPNEGLSKGSHLYTFRKGITPLGIILALGMGLSPSIPSGLTFRGGPLWKVSSVLPLTHSPQYLSPYLYTSLNCLPLNRIILTWSLICSSKSRPLALHN